MRIQASCTVRGGNKVLFQVLNDADYTFDNHRIWSANAANTTTFEYNTAKELTKMHDAWGGETNFTYDGFGRMITKALTEIDSQTYTAIYTYGYGGMLTDVDTGIPGESDVSYAYGGDGMRRERTSGGVTTRYNWFNDEDATNRDIMYEFWYRQLPCSVWICSSANHAQRGGNSEAAVARGFCKGAFTASWELGQEGK